MPADSHAKQQGCLKENISFFVAIAHATLAVTVLPLRKVYVSDGLYRLQPACALPATHALTTLSKMMSAPQSCTQCGHSQHSKCVFELDKFSGLIPSLQAKRLRHGPQDSAPLFQA